MQRILVTKSVGGATVGLFVPLAIFQDAYYLEWDRRLEKQTRLYEKDQVAYEVGMRTGNWKLWERVNEELSEILRTK